jgi:TnpA family transposase
MATIKRGDSTASQLFKILSSSSKDNELYRAIKEFGRLIKSKFMLEYIDSEPLRRSIQKQLNLVELGQKLSGAVFFGRKGKLFVGTPNEMLKVVACTALIKNAIVLWNYLFLSNFYHGLESKEEKIELIESIRRGSVIAWLHISMRGFYDFDHKYKKSFNASINDMMKIKIYSRPT